MVASIETKQAWRVLVPIADIPDHVLKPWREGAANSAQFLNYTAEGIAKRKLANEAGHWVCSLATVTGQLGSAIEVYLVSLEG